MKKGYYFLFLKQNRSFNLGTPMDAKTSFRFLKKYQIVWHNHFNSPTYFLWVPCSFTVYLPSHVWEW